MKQRIKEYWDSRAVQHQQSPSVTTDDIHLRELECSVLSQELGRIPPLERTLVLDVGCGDGYSTIRLAQALPGTSFLGIDYSESMIALACQRLRAEAHLLDRVRFAIGDVTNLRSVCGQVLYDVVVSIRCLINLESRESQTEAFSQIAAHTRPGGLFIAIENFMEGHDAMNDVRRRLDLPEIPVRWHNLYFTEQEFLTMAAPFFETITFSDFASSYYLATRVIYAAMCRIRGESVDYNHVIHQLAPLLPPVGKFSPIRLAKLYRKCHAP